MTTPNLLDTSNQSTPNVPDSVSDVCASRSPTGYRWKRVIELGYDESDGGRVSDRGGGKEGEGRNDATVDDSLDGDEPACFHCGKVSSELMRCGRCHVARYCTRECQVTNWKGGDGKVGHKFSCAAYKRVGDDMMIIFGDDKDSARQDVLSRIRFYAYPYAVHASRTTGRGFLFVQSDSSLAVMSLPIPILSNGRVCPKRRSVMLHWLTVEEYVSEVCMDDFELAGATRELREAVDGYDERVELPILMRFRCGHVAVGIVPLVPDFNLCLMLGKEYYGQGDGAAVQLNIDDM